MSESPKNLYFFPYSLERVLLYSIQIYRFLHHSGGVGDIEIIPWIYELYKTQRQIVEEQYSPYCKFFINDL